MLLPEIHFVLHRTCLSSAISLLKFACLKVIKERDESQTGVHSPDSMQIKGKSAVSTDASSAARSTANLDHSGDMTSYLSVVHQHGNTEIPNKRSFAFCSHDNP